MAYVDTPDGRAALDEAARLARRTGQRRSGSTPWWPRVTRRCRSWSAQDAEHAFLDTARETYEQSLQTGGRRGRRTWTSDWRLLTGDVVDTLAELDEVDVLFCGSRGYGPARRVLLGGVSTRLVRRARRPVVVVPRSG